MVIVPVLQVVLVPVVFVYIAFAGFFVCLFVCCCFLCVFFFFFFCILIASNFGE